MAHPGGRPTKYDPMFCEMIIDHMKQGMSLRSFGATAGCNVDTLYEWAKTHPEFSDAIKTGRQLQEQFWEKTGIAAAHGKIPGFSGTAFVWMTKNMLGWRDRVELSGDQNRPIQIQTHLENTSMDQLQLIGQRLLGVLHDPNKTV